MDSSSEPFFLGNKKFFKSNSFEELKTTSLVLGSDLRYFSKNNEIGIHISDTSITEITLFSILKNIKNIKSDGVLKILYLSRTNVGRLQPDSIIPYFKNLDFLCISKNREIKKLELNNLSNLKEFVAFGNEKLEELKFIGSFLKLEKLDASNCRLTSLDVSNMPSLEYLNVSNNKIEKLFLSNTKNLKYFFAEGNSKLSITWPKKWIHDKLEILGLDESNELISKDILDMAKSSSDIELRENLKAYLKFEQKHEENSKVPINRYQLILLGNSTSGKTELRHRLFNDQRKEFGSTHGVSFFSTILSGIEIFGYDFGGQDYYHALHLPFFDFTSHYILVWGNYDKKSWGEFDPDNYWGGLENVENREEEILNHPNKYWIKSIESHINSQDFLSYYRDTFSKDERNDERFLNNYFNSKTIELLNEYKSDPEREKIYSDDKSYITLSKKPKLDIVHNRRENQKEKFLNVKDLKEIPRILVDEIKSFNFLEDEIGIWLREKIKKENLLQKNEILIEIKELGEELISSPNVIIEESTLKEKIKKINSNYDERDVFQFTKSLINYHYIIYHDFKIHEQKDKIYVTNVEKFTQYLYQVLNKELLSSDTSQGYFSKEDAYERIETDNIKLKDYILQFLIESNIIFEVNDSPKENKKYFAPTYLPLVKNQVEKLFLQSFEDPDCKFELNSFFHPNLMLKVVQEYQSKMLLVKDERNNKFLIWKNCVIIYNLNEKSKQFLKLQLLLPSKENPTLIPTFTISRSSVGFIENDQFAKVFSEIKELLTKYSPKIYVKTPYLGKNGECDYIDFKDVERADNLSEGKNKKSAFISSNNVLYYKHDFRHFHKNMKAPLKIFIAYSKYDDDYRKELKDHLYPGIVEGTFIVFDDREMDMGEKWHARLKKELEQCDVFILLISVKTLGTSFVMNVEIPEAKKRNERGSLKIIPILVSPCDWTKTGLSELNIFDKAQPVGSKDNNHDLSRELSVNERASKWQEIVKKIENINTNGLNPTNGPTPSNEPISGTDKENDGK